MQGKDGLKVRFLIFSFISLHPLPYPNLRNTLWLLLLKLTTRWRDRMRTDFVQDDLWHRPTLRLVVNRSISYLAA